LGIEVSDRTQRTRSPERALFPRAAVSTDPWNGARSHVCSPSVPDSEGLEVNKSLLYVIAGITLIAIGIPIEAMWTSSLAGEYLAYIGVILLIAGGITALIGKLRKRA
jgi:hypothetical protein